MAIMTFHNITARGDETSQPKGVMELHFTSGKQDNVVFLFLSHGILDLQIVTQKEDMDIHKANT